jgi:TP901 family phage tail tape measure protein
MAVDVLVTEIKAKDSFSAPLSTMGRNLQGFTSKAIASFARLGRQFDKTTTALKSINNQFSKLDTITGIGAGAALGVGAALGAQSVLDLDKNLSAAGAKFEVFNEEGGRASKMFKSLEKAALDVGANTEFSSAQAAEGLNFLALAGFKAQQAIKALPVVTDLATAAQIELGMATDIATDTMGAMLPKTNSLVQKQKDLIRVSNVLAKTTTTSNTNMEDMFEAVKEGGAPFAQTGGSIEEFAALVGVMANAGIKGSRAGTAIKNMAVNLQAPSKVMNKSLSKMGINIDDGTGKMKKMSVILGEMTENTKDWTSIQRNAAFATIFGKVALSGATITFKEGQKGIEDYVKTIESAETATKDMATFMRSGLSGAVARAKSALDAIAISIGQAFEPEINSAIKSITNFAGKAKDWFLTNKETIKTVVKLTAQLIPFVIGLKVLIGIMSVVNAVMLANPAVLIAAGIVILSAALFLMINNWEASQKAIDGFFKNVGPVTRMLNAFVEMMWELSKAAVNVAKAFATEGIVGGIKQLGKSLALFVLKPLFMINDIMEDLGKRFGFTVDTSIADKVKGFFTDDESQKTEAIPAIDAKQARTESITKEISTQKNELGITVNDPDNRISVDEVPQGVKLVQQLTTSFQ